MDTNINIEQMIVSHFFGYTNRQQGKKNKPSSIELSNQISWIAYYLRYGMIYSGINVGRAAVIRTEPSTSSTHSNSRSYSPSWEEGNDNRTMAR